MPHRGIYESVELTIDKFIDTVKDASASGTLQHWIGYEETLRK